MKILVINDSRNIFRVFEKLLYDFQVDFMSIPESINEYEIIIIFDKLLDQLIHVKNVLLFVLSEEEEIEEQYNRENIFYFCAPVNLNKLRNKILVLNKQIPLASHLISELKESQLNNSVWIKVDSTPKSMKNIQNNINILTCNQVMKNWILLILNEINTYQQIIEIELKIRNNNNLDVYIIHNKKINDDTFFLKNYAHDIQTKYHNFNYYTKISIQHYDQIASKTHYA